jgi:hypothetical protein
MSRPPTGPRRPLRQAPVQWAPLPLPEAPAEEVTELVERLAKFREQLADAERQVHMIDMTFGDVPALPPGSRTHYRIEARVARNRVMLWTREVRALERRARALGLKP